MGTQYQRRRSSLDPNLPRGESSPAIQVRLPRDLRAALDARAARRGLVRSGAIREALVDWLNATDDDARKAMTT